MAFNLEKEALVASGLEEKGFEIILVNWTPSQNGLTLKKCMTFLPLFGLKIYLRPFGRINLIDTGEEAFIGSMMSLMPNFTRKISQ